MHCVDIGLRIPYKQVFAETLTDPIVFNSFRQISTNVRLGMTTVIATLIVRIRPDHSTVSATPATLWTTIIIASVRSVTLMWFLSEKVRRAYVVYCIIVSITIHTNLYYLVSAP